MDIYVAASQLGKYPPLSLSLSLLSLLLSLFCFLFCLHSLSKLLRYTVSYNHVYKHRILVIIKGIANCFCKKVYVSYLRLIDEPSNKPNDKTKMLIHNLHLLTGAGHKQTFLVVAYKQPARMFKCWIVKSIFYAICWIAIYPVHSAIQHLHEWPLGMLFYGSCSGPFGC